MKTQKLEYSLIDIDTVARMLKQLLQHYPVMTFSGSLGAGKTTLVQALLRQCGVTERVTSPTFAYVNHYINDQEMIFYHFDLYRIDNLADFCARGFDEYLYAPKSFALIEWPEHILPLLQERVCHVQLDYHDDVIKRVLRIKCKK